MDIKRKVREGKDEIRLQKEIKDKQLNKYVRRKRGKESRKRVSRKKEWK